MRRVLLRGIVLTILAETLKEDAGVIWYFALNKAKLMMLTYPVSQLFIMGIFYTPNFLISWSTVQREGCM
jgi:tetrahydromethanopterin S-methyltransferase subunit D